MKKISRRHFTTGLFGFLAGLMLSKKAHAARPTPRSAEGPFYPQPHMRRPDIDNNLVKIQGLVEQVGGEVFTLRGTIKDQNASPLGGMRIEIWQCDLNGNYMHPRDRRSANFDPAFQGFGHDITDETGAYVFRTIKPAPYTGRTPHIHVKVLKGKRELLTTQFYVKDHPDNARDFLFNFMSNDEANRVSMDIKNGQNGAEAVLDVII